MTSNVAKEDDLQKQILAENRRVHALEGGLYLKRHPEQTHFFQTEILRNSLNKVCADLGDGEAHILDLGCGTGYLTLKLLARGHRVTGVDLSGEMLDALQQQIPKAARGRFTSRLMAVEEFLQTGGDSYDAVVMSALLHHLYDFESTVRGVCKKLAPGGCLLIFFEPLKQEIQSSLRFALHKGIARLDEAFYRLSMRLGGVPIFEEDYCLSDYQRRFGGIDPRHLADILDSEGMDVLDLETYCSRRHGLPAFLATRLIGSENTFNLLAKKATV